MEKGRLTIDISSRSIMRVILFGLLVTTLFYLRTLILVVLTAIVIASFVESGVIFLKKRGFRRTIAVVLIYLVSLLLLAGVFYLFIPVFINELGGISDLISRFVPNVSAAAEAGSKFLQSFSSLETFIQSVQAVTAGAGGGFFQTLVALFGGIANVVILFVLSFYFSAEERGIEKFLRIVTPIKQEEYVVSLWERTRHKISRWMQGQMLLGLIVGTLAFAGLSILHIDYALLLAIATAVFELVPFGMILATIPAVGLAFIDGGTSIGLMTLGLFIVLQQIENYILVPLIVRRTTGLPPLVVILALLMGVRLAGFWGVVLAMPVAVFLLELLNDVERKKIFQREDTKDA